MFDGINKWAYFIIQFIVSCIVTSIVWYLFVVIGMNEVEMSFTPLFYLLGGTLVHVVLTVIYILFGWRKVDEWRWWCILISAGINIVTFFIGIEGSYLINLLVAYY
ncbi:MAG: hypothetical protein J6U54_23655 [Clostridiales bacterium]|nr:hypothetical protein [Clostridiales bacterium]